MMTPPGISRVVFDAVSTALETTTAPLTERDARRLSYLLTSRVVAGIESRWREILLAEIRRGWVNATSAGAWDRRGWTAANRVARVLPREVVMAAVKRMVLEYDPDPDTGNPLDIPVGEYVRVWERRL